MLSRLEFRAPAPTGEPTKDYRQLVAAIQEHFRRLNDANVLAIDGGQLDGSPVGANSASTGKFTTLQVTTGLTLPAATTWTPTDASGAGLTLTVNSATYLDLGHIIIGQCDITYPATASGASAKIGGLPKTIAKNQVAHLLTGIGVTGGEYMNLADGTTILQPSVGTGGVTNATLSSKQLFSSFVYLY